MKKVLTALLMLLQNQIVWANAELPDVTEIECFIHSNTVPLEISQSDYEKLMSGEALGLGWSSHQTFAQDYKKEILSSLEFKTADLIETRCFDHYWPMSEGNEEDKHHHIQEARYRVKGFYWVDGMRHKLGELKIQRY